jgi:glutathione synthase
MNKALKIAIQMDDIAKIKFETDSSLLLALEAQNRGFEIFYYRPEDLVLQDFKVMAYSHAIKLNNNALNYYQLSAAFLLDLAQVDVILIRQDPPVNMQYLSSCLMLEMLSSSTLIINSPKAIRDCPEKLFIFNFPHLMPQTLLTRNIEAIKEFRNIHQDIVLKPLYGHGGVDVFKISPHDYNFNAIISLLLKNYDSPMIVQKFLPQVLAQEKRIFVVDGIAVAGISKQPTGGEIRANLAHGAKIAAYELTDVDIAIAQEVGVALKSRGIIFAGIDMIGNYITEINITSPTLIPAVNKLNNIKLESIIWDCIIKKKA